MSDFKKALLKIQLQRKQAKKVDLRRVNTIVALYMVLPLYPGTRVLQMWAFDCKLAEDRKGQDDCRAALASPASQLMASTIWAVQEERSMQEQERRGRESKGSDWCAEEERRRRKSRRRGEKVRRKGKEEGRGGGKVWEGKGEPPSIQASWNGKGARWRRGQCCSACEGEREHACVEVEGSIRGCAAAGSTSSHTLSPPSLGLHHLASEWSR
jgi:hypothetical protein